MSQKLGFTLIEMLLALTLMVMVLCSVLFAINYSQRFWGSALAQNERLAIMQDLLATITDELKFSDAGTITFDYHDQKVRRRKGNTTAYLTTEGQIDSLSITQPFPKLFQIVLVSKGIKLEALALCRN